MKLHYKNAIRTPLLNWYEIHKRDLPWRRTSDPYAIWISEVMAQQTRIDTVIPYYLSFMSCYPDIKALANSSQQTVLKQWEGLGYYARARNLHKASRLVVNKYNAQIPDNWDSIRSLPGIGDYIASAILSIAYNKPYAVLDGNVKRVLARVFLMRYPVNKSTSHARFKKQADRLMDKKNAGQFNQAMMELGALVCRPKNPDCNVCPIMPDCLAKKNNQVDEFPKRQKTKAIPLYRIAVGIVQKQNRVLITRRKPEGLLGGLWEFPGGKIKPGESGREACVREIKEETNLDIGELQLLTQVKHAYTHFKIRMKVYLCKYIKGRVKLNGPDAHLWTTVDQLDKYPFPKANLKFFSELKSRLSD